MALQPEESELLRNIYREVGETKTLVGTMADTVAAHIADDKIIHERLHARITPLQAESKVSTLKHRIAIVLGLSGVGAGSLGAAEPGWLASILRSLGG